MSAEEPSLAPQDGARKVIDGKDCIYYDGYWIRYYAPPPESLTAKRRLIEHLSRRLVHHTEVGINTPGKKLELARRAYLAESDPARRRVNAAMLAGALFNRATDIFTTLVDLQQKGVHIEPDGDLMRQCGQYFQEALSFAGNVKHFSGDEGIDELWGEPIKAFTMPIKDFYHSRYIKIAQTMRDIDRIAAALVEVFEHDRAFEGLGARVLAFAEAAKLESETLRSDPVIFEVWPAFVACGEAVSDFRPILAPGAPEFVARRAEEGVRLIAEGKELLTYLAGARVPMPKSTRDFLDRCEAYAAAAGPR